MGSLIERSACYVSNKGRAYGLGLGCLGYTARAIAYVFAITSVRQRFSLVDPIFFQY